MVDTDSELTISAAKWFTLAGRPVRQSRRDEIQVGHIMTHWDQITTLDWRDVRTIRVSDIVKLLKRTRAIVEYADRGGIIVRGLISRLRIERQLGCS